MDIVEIKQEFDDDLLEIVKCESKTQFDDGATEIKMEYPGEGQLISEAIIKVECADETSKENFETKIKCEDMKVESLNENDTSESTGKKTHKCDVCHKSFANSSSLRKHLKTHTVVVGENLHQCVVCNKSFTSRNSLNLHSRIHTGEKPYKCAVCNESLSQKAAFFMNKHPTTLKGEKLGKPYTCIVCEKCFVIKNQSGVKKTTDLKKNMAENLQQIFANKKK